MAVPWKSFPPRSEQARIDDYYRFEALYDGLHELAFRVEIALRNYDKSGDELTYVKLAYPALIVNVAANLLVGEPPVVSYPKDLPDLNKALKKIWSASKLASVLMEACQDSGFRGDAVFIVRKSAKNGVIIEPKPAYSYYPELDPDNCREVLSERLAWKRDYRGRKILRVDEYQQSRIVREAYFLAEDGSIKGQVQEPDLSLIVGGPPVISTGVGDRNTLVHVPNMRKSNGFFGSSDYKGIESLFDEANNRLTQLCIVLDKHAAPKMIGPVDMVDPRGRVDLSGDFIGIGPEAQKPELLVWNAELNAAFKALQIILDEIYRQAEISPVLAGYIAGASYDSGRAFRMQFIQTLAKMARKRLYLEPGLLEAIRIAVSMETGIPYQELPDAMISWRDGLPKDTAEAVQTESVALSAGLTSLLDAIRRTYDCSEDTALAILEQIEAEKKSSMGASAPEQITDANEGEVLEPDPEDASEET